MSIKMYQKMEERLRQIRNGEAVGYDHEWGMEAAAMDEDALLDQMDDVWWSLSPEEKLSINQGK
jgi:hypothetical protein